MSQLDQQTQAAVANAGELFIRAAAVLGTLTEQQRSSAGGFVVLVALATPVRTPTFAFDT
ncbi:hypothetical protein LA345_40270 (plasmid) [Burkholderia vietnamiensis]|nr:hypothetical protein [Burkholderia vietnamiensis]